MLSIGKLLLIRLVVAFVMAVVVPGPGFGEERVLTIGTGGPGGVYFPAGNAVCRMVNRYHKETGLRCEARISGGSVSNLAALRAGNLDLGIVQSDWQYNAFQGTGLFTEQGPFTQLRSLLSLHSEPFTVVARKGVGIESFEDLKGRRVNVGNPGSGQRNTLEVLLAAMGWTLDDFELASELPSEEQARAMCDGKVEAIIYTVGHPNRSILEATVLCDALLVAVEGPALDALLSQYPYYAKTVVPGQMYRNNPQDIPTFGVKATLVGTTALSVETVNHIVRAVFLNLDTFRALHPAFSHLEVESMIDAGNSATLHPGAARAFTEMGYRDVPAGDAVVPPLPTDAAQSLTPGDRGKGPE